MRSLLLLSALLVAASAQPSTPPHMLFSPREYFVGTDTTFSLTTYSAESFRVSLRLTYHDCTCTPRQECGDFMVAAEDVQTTSALIFQPTVLTVKLPSLDELASRRYYLAIRSSEGHVFMSRRQINFFSRGFGFMLVKTDKPIYKPSQTVNICVVFLDPTLKPHNADATTEVVIRDARFRQILKTRVIVPGGDGVGCMDVSLSEEPNLGTWSARASLILDAGEGQCQFYYGRAQASCNFKVDEFVLPRFEVNLDGPSQITRRQNRIEGTVDATYTFGENVDGTVKVNATLSASGRRESFLFSDITADLRNGQYEFSIDADEYRSKVRYRYDPFCVRSSIRITAEVTEGGRNTTQSDSIVVPLVSNPISLSFDENTPTVFRPGLAYTFIGIAVDADDAPALRKRIQVTATANNGRVTLLDDSYMTDRNGRIRVTVPVNFDTNCLKITMSATDPSEFCDREVVCFSPSPMYSPTGSYLQLSNVSPSSEITVGQKITVTATTTFLFNTLHIMMIGQGNVLLHLAEFPTNRGRGVLRMSVRLQIPHSAVPRVKILAVVARDDGELVADLIEIPVTCELEHQVGLSFSDKREASPGDEVSIVTSASPDSVVVLGVIDKSLTLLADECKSVDTNNVCGLLRGLTSGRSPASASCSTESESACCPSTCSEPTKRVVSDIFTAAGITLNTNMFQPNRPPTPNPPSRTPYPTYPPFFFDQPFEALPPDAEAGPAPPQPPPPPLDDVVDTEADGDTPEEDEGSTDIRTFFPETWIWEVLRTDKSGRAVWNSTVPDTITTWNAEAIAINQASGLGISPLAQLVVKKELFVSLELPYSIIFGEIVTVTPLVLYFGRERNALVTVSVVVSDELTLLENQLFEDGLVGVARGSGTPFNLKLKPRAIGRLPITICIRDPDADEDAPCIDAVTKLLFVKPGCERFQITNNVYAVNASGEYCFDYRLPTCVIPGSSKAVISITGDLLSPPDLDRLLVLPYGCGEQNMVKIAINIVVTSYLKITNQLPDVLAPKIRNNLQTGYQRQLTYLQGEGCFSIWSHSKCSLWLTAFTARYLIEASDPELIECLGFPEGSELVDPSVIRGAVLYLIRQQEESGRFPVIGRLHNYYLLSRDNFIGLTGYVLLTLRSAASISELASRSVQRAIGQAEQYIVSQYNDEEVLFCNYGLALSTAALATSTDPRVRSSVTSMVTELKSRIQDSRNYPGACFLCNDCPNDEDTSSTSDESCSSRPRGEGSSSCVETTAYALRALLAVGDRESTVCLAQWLLQVKGASGGFYSSQDTLVALDALGRFAAETFTPELNKAVTVRLTGPPTKTYTYSVTTENRYERKDFEVHNIPSVNNCVSYTGVGTAIIQSTLEYYGCSCCDDTQIFSLILGTRKTDSQLTLSITVSYLGEGVSNMAIVDVEIPSGYVFTGHDDVSGVIERREARGSNVVFYINDIEGTIVIGLSFREEFVVEDHQQLPVTVYDYYEPEKIITRYYLPVTSGTLAMPTRLPPFSDSPFPTPTPDDEREEADEEEETT